MKITFEKRKSSVDFQAQTNHADESVGYAIFTLHKLIALKHQYGRCVYSGSVWTQSCVHKDFNQNKVQSTNSEVDQLSACA